MNKPIAPSEQRGIALICATLGGGGAERVMATLANGLYRAGYRVDIVLVQRSGSYLDELDPGVGIVDLASRRTLLALIPLIRYLRRSRPKAMLATLWHVNAVAVLARFLARVPLRLVLRETSTPSRHRGGHRETALVRALGPVYRAADRVVAPSIGAAEDLITEFNVARWRIAVIANPLDIPRIQALATAPTGDGVRGTERLPVVLAVGRLSREKDLPTLIRAFAIARARVPSRLLILGEGPDRRFLEDLVESLGLDEHVHMPGFADNPFSFMRQSSVYVLSSLHEGMPNTLLQALAAGTPVVATDCQSGPREILEGGRWGRLVPVGDIDAVADAILDGLAGRIETPPIDWVHERYGLDGITGKYLDVLLDPAHRADAMRAIPKGSRPT